MATFGRKTTFFYLLILSPASNLTTADHSDDGWSPSMIGKSLSIHGERIKKIRREFHQKLGDYLPSDCSEAELNRKLVPTDVVPHSLLHLDFNSRAALSDEAFEGKSDVKSFSHDATVVGRRQSLSKRIRQRYRVLLSRKFESEIFCKRRREHDEL